METLTAAAAAGPLAVYESVRCLECGEVYSKPSSGGTVQKNPGCPTCGYVGWLPVSLPAAGSQRLRSGEDRLPFRRGRSR